MMIVFDLDGTLVDTSGDIVRVINAVLSQRGLAPMSHDRVMSHVGYGTHHLLRQVLGREPDEREVVSARRRFVELYAEDPARDSHLFPGVRETLQALVTDHPMAVVSNKAGELVRATVRALDLTGYFHPVLGGDDAAALKPSPDGILQAIRTRGAQPSGAVMVGDMNLDVAAGRAAGTRTVFASYGFGSLGAGDPTPDASIERFGELVALVAEGGATPRG